MSSLPPPTKPDPGDRDARNTYRNTCPSFGDICETPNLRDRSSDCVFASEPIRGENVRMEFNGGDIVGVDPNMGVLRIRIDASTARRPIFAETP